MAALRANDMVAIQKELDQREPSAGARLLLNEHPMTVAARRGNQPALALLKSSGYDLNSRNASGDSALHVALSRNDVAMTTWLLAEGADIFALNNNRYFPVRVGLFRNSDDACMVLLRWSMQQGSLESLVALETTLQERFPKENIVGVDRFKYLKKLKGLLGNLSSISAPK
jgi:ankyrin repeat protein